MGNEDSLSDRLKISRKDAEMVSRKDANLPSADAKKYK